MAASESLCGLVSDLGLLHTRALLPQIQADLDLLFPHIQSGVAPWELITASVLFQTNMYSISRLGRRSFTLGELGIVAALGVTLMLEAINLTLAKVSDLAVSAKHPRRTLS